MANPQCNSSTQIFWNGPSFLSATAIFSDSGLTVPAADGWYAFGLIIRQVLNGVLLSPLPCDECVIPCGDPFVFNSGGIGEYKIQFNMGTIPGAGQITFSPGIARTTDYAIPDQCTWEYNGQSSNEYSSMQAGYMRGLIGAPDRFSYGKDCLSTQSPSGNNYLLSTDIGTNNIQAWGQAFTYNVGSGLFTPPGVAVNPVPPFPPYVAMGQTGLNTGWTGLSNNALVPNNTHPSTLLTWNCSNKSNWSCNPGTGLGVPQSPYNPNLPLAPNLPPWSSLGGTSWPSVGITYKQAVMVIPSPPGVISSTMTVTVSGPCYNTWWGIDVKCPEPLTPIFSSTEFGDLEYDQSPGGQASKTPLNTTLKGSGTTKCGFITPCSPGLLIDENPGVNFNDPLQFPPNGIVSGDLVKDPATGYFAVISNVAPLGNVFTMTNVNPAQDAAGALDNTNVPYEIYRKGVCDYTINDFVYHVPVDAWGNSNPNSYYNIGGDMFPANLPNGQPKGVLGMGDWVFEDINGVTPVAVGVYKMRFDALDGLGIRTWAVQVGPREYQDTSLFGTGAFVQDVNPGPLQHSDPPEDYVGQSGYIPDYPAPITFNQVQRTGARKAGIVRSITPCDPPDSFDCIAPAGNCVDPGTGLGAYTTLAQCQSNCVPTPSWDCISGNCVDPGTGLGAYSTLAACNTACTPVAPCSGSFATPTLPVGQYNIDMDAGAATGAIIVRFDPYQVPDRCTWTYDGVSASEYSSPSDGYMTGIIGCVAGGGTNGCGAPGGSNPMITNGLGSNGVTFAGTVSNWDPATTAFVSTGTTVNMGPYTNQASGGTTLTPGLVGPGYSMMVVPKPNATPSLVQFQMDGPCGSTIFNFEANCPVKLPRKDRGELVTTTGKCGIYTHDFYTASPQYVDGISLFLDVHDWVFEDEDGVTPLPAGDYPAKFPGGPNRIITVANGVITAMVACTP